MVHSLVFLDDDDKLENLSHNSLVTQQFTILQDVKGASHC